MFITRPFSETYQSLKTNKGRNIFTGFGIMWALLMLVILLGAGTGFRKGIIKEFAQLGENKLHVYGRFAPTGPIYFDQATLNQIENNFNFVRCASITFSTNTPVIYGGECHESARILGVTNNHLESTQMTCASGRFLSIRDQIEGRQVCVIGNQLKDQLFKKQNPIGQYILINGSGFQVIGVLDKEGVFENQENKSILIDREVFFQYFGGLRCSFNHFQLLLQKNIDPDWAESKLRTHLAKLYRFDPKDDSALQILSMAKQTKKINALFDMIDWGIWIVGICFLFSGVVGISNMMLVVVKERTKEIGIRKVIGAKSREILVMILLESIIISLVAGFVGMLGGIGTIQLINYLLTKVPIPLMTPLVFESSATIAALIILIIAGCFAGLLPAMKAISIKPIEALNTE